MFTGLRSSVWFHCPPAVLLSSLPLYSRRPLVCLPGFLQSVLVFLWTTAPHTVLTQLGWRATSNSINVHALVVNQRAASLQAILPSLPPSPPLPHIPLSFLLPSCLISLYLAFSSSQPYFCFPASPL